MNLSYFLIPFFFLLSVQTNHSQSLSFSSFQKIEDIPNFQLTSSVVFEKQILMAGHSRNPSGDIDAMLVRIDKDGAIIQRKSIGQPDIFERCSDIIIGSDQTIWVLINAFKNNKPIVQLYQLDKRLSELKKITLDLEKVQEGKKLALRNKNEINIALLYRKESMSGYPVIASYSIKEQTFSYTHLDYDNPPISKMETEKIFYIDNNGNKKQPSKEELLRMQKSMDAHTKQLNKNVNNILVTENRTILVGAENTANFGDFWAAEVSNTGKINWEKVFEKKDDVGADALVTARFDGSNTALFGNHYRKKDNLNYNFNYVLVDKNGHELINKIYDTGFDESLIDVIPTNKGYIICGYVDIEPNKKIKGTSTITVGQQVINTNLLFLNIHKDGTLIEEIPLEKEGFQKAISILPINEKEFYILGTHSNINEEKSLFLLKASLN